MRNKFSSSSLSRAQRGSTLIVGLMLLAVMSIMVAATVAVAILQERMAGNMRDQATAFQRGEAALVAIEDIMEATDTAADPNPFKPFRRVYFEQACSAPVNGLCHEPMSSTSSWINWSESDWITNGSNDAGNDTRFIVNWLGYAEGNVPTGTEPCDVLFQVIVRAPGDGDNTYVLLESTFRQRVSCG